MNDSNGLPAQSDLAAVPSKHQLRGGADCRNSGASSPCDFYKAGATQSPLLVPSLFTSGSFTQFLAEMDDLSVRVCVPTWVCACLRACVRACA